LILLGSFNEKKQQEGNGSKAGQKRQYRSKIRRDDDLAKSQPMRSIRLTTTYTGVQTAPVQMDHIKTAVCFMSVAIKA
jgi:hypothetical protein